jgi:hypothetical protein
MSWHLPRPARSRWVLRPRARLRTHLSRHLFTASSGSSTVGSLRSYSYSPRTEEDLMFDLLCECARARSGRSLRTESSWGLGRLTMKPVRLCVLFSLAFGAGFCFALRLYQFHTHHSHRHPPRTAPEVRCLPPNPHLFLVQGIFFCRPGFGKPPPRKQSQGSSKIGS